jgi:hypothetical protein
MKKKAKRKSRSIVTGYLEKISSKVFDEYRKQITELIKGNYGVYALYRREKLYYIGLASDFKKRINYHLRDHHKGKWTHFSLYIIRKTDHIREIETILLRIADPTGNYIKGKLKGSRNLRPTLKRIMTEDSRRVIGEILGQEDKPVKRTKAKTRHKIRAKGDRPLKGFLRGWQRIYATYKGKDYKAKVLPNGVIELMPSKKRFDSPSLAGISVTNKKTMNGWKFWKYKDKNGELVYIDQLRK